VAEESGRLVDVVDELAGGQGLIDPFELYLPTVSKRERLTAGEELGH